MDGRMEGHPFRPRGVPRAPLGLAAGDPPHPHFRMTENRPDIRTFPGEDPQVGYVAGWAYLCEECERRGSLPRPLEGTHSSHSFDLGQGTLAEISGGCSLGCTSQFPRGGEVTIPKVCPTVRPLGLPQVPCCTAMRGGVAPTSHGVGGGRQASSFVSILVVPRYRNNLFTQPQDYQYQLPPSEMFHLQALILRSAQMEVTGGGM